MIRFEHASTALYGRPWAILPQSYQAMHDLFQTHVRGEKINVMGSEVECKLPQEYSIINGVAVIEIHGALGHRMSNFEKACMGGVDYIDIQQAISKSDSDPAVDAILLHIDSPGGMVIGLPETADAIAQSEKPTVSFTDSLCASAGYYLAASADSVYASQSASVGCIGTLMTWIDISKAYEQQGLKRELIASGKYKGMLMPGMPITDEQRVMLQDEVDMLADEFKEHVISNRGQIDPEYMEGQTVSGQVALASGLIDEIANFEDALFEAQEMATETKGE